jgi:hypothetical protein
LTTTRDAEAAAASQLALAQQTHARAQLARAAAQRAVEQAVAGVDWRALCHRRSFHLPPNAADIVVSHLEGETRTLCTLACVDRSWAAAVTRSTAVWRVLRVVTPPLFTDLGEKTFGHSVTDAVLARLVARSGGTLEELHLDGCPAVTAAGLGPVVQHHTTLKLLKLRRCKIAVDGLVRVLRAHRPPGGTQHAFRLEGSIPLTPSIERRYLRLTNENMRYDLVREEVEKLEPLCLGTDQYESACAKCHQMHPVDEKGRCCKGYSSTTCFSDTCAGCVEDGWPADVPAFVRRLDCASSDEQKCYDCAVAEVSLPVKQADAFPCAYCLDCVWWEDTRHPCAKCGARVCPYCNFCVRWLDAADGDDGICSDDELFHDDAETSLFEDKRTASQRLRCGHTRCCGAMLCGSCAAAPEDADERVNGPACAECGVPLCAACMTLGGSVASLPLSDELRCCRECAAHGHCPTTDDAAAPDRQAPRRTTAGGPSAALLKATQPRADGRLALREARESLAKERLARQAKQAAGWRSSKRARIGD